MGDANNKPPDTAPATLPVASMPSRRTLLKTALTTGASVLLAAGSSPRSSSAADPPPEHSPQFTAAYAKLIGDTEPKPGPVRLELPEIAENGNMVPFTVSVDSPMTPDNNVQTITLFSTGNPQPVIATFTFSPLSGRALVSGRLRLARTQDLIAVAQLSTGGMIKGTGRVEVTIGGCGTG